MKRANQKKKKLKVNKKKESEKTADKSKREAHLERLKSYVFKCGVRKVWKKELDGLNVTQSVAKVTRILEELGMQGRPTLQRCKEIKERREYEKEMEVIDEANILSSKRRSQTTYNPKPAACLADSFAFLSKLGDPDA